MSVMDKKILTSFGQPPWGFSPAGEASFQPSQNQNFLKEAFMKTSLLFWVPPNACQEVLQHILPSLVTSFLSWIWWAISYKRPAAGRGRVASGTETSSQLPEGIGVSMEGGIGQTWMNCKWAYQASWSNTPHARNNKELHSYLLCLLHNTRATSGTEHSLLVLHFQGWAEIAVMKAALFRFRSSL